MQHSLLKTFEPNYQGRDFVIGDLHGALPCFERLLNGIKFDVSKDRMFSVGDLVDRGPDSLECLDLLAQPWFHAVLSNHEQMMLEAFTGGPMGDYWLMNGGVWGIEYLNDHKNRSSSSNELTRRIPSDSSVKCFELLEKVKALPYLITVNRKDGSKVHILHAELPPHEGTITDSDLSSPGKVERLAKSFSGEGEYFLWGRYMYADFSRANLQDIERQIRVLRHRLRGGVGVFNDKLSHIISGHTIVQRPLTLIGQTNIDTCAYRACEPGAPSWAGLTCLELDTWTFYKATPTSFEQVQPLVINTTDLYAPKDEE